MNAANNDEKRQKRQINTDHNRKSKKAKIVNIDPGKSNERVQMNYWRWVNYILFDNLNLCRELLVLLVTFGSRKTFDCVRR